MKRWHLHFTILALCVCLTGAAIAQITIREPDLNGRPGLTKSLASSAGAVDVDLGQAGPHQTWDFSAMEAQFAFLECYLEPGGCPGAGSFPNATVCTNRNINDGVRFWYTFIKVDDQGATTLGMAIDVPSLDTTFICNIESNRPHIGFPLNYGDEWDLYLNLSSFAGEVKDTIHYEVDGWGTIIDAAGNFECLRIHIFTTEYDFTEDPVDTTFSHDYLWLAEGFGEIVKIESEDNEENPNFTFGKFQRTTGVEVGVQREPARTLPVAAALQPAYPNPFNPSTELIFTVSQSDLVNLGVYDVNGRLVTMLVNGTFTPGAYRVSFDAAHLSQGLYYARLNAGQTRQVQKLLLIK